MIRDAIAVLVAAGLLAPVRIVQAQSLAQVADRERARRAALVQDGQERSKPVITSEDLDNMGLRGSSVFSPDGERFSAVFPLQPQIWRRSEPTTSSTYVTKYRDVVFSVVTADIGRAEYHAKSVEQHLDEIRDAAIESLNDTSYESQRPVAAHGLPGKEYVVRFTARRAGKSGVVRMWVFVAEKRSYVALVMCAPGRENDPVAERFLRSFRVLT